MKAGRLSNEREKRASGTHMHDLQPVYGVLRVKPASPFKRSSFPQSDKKKVLQKFKVHHGRFAHSGGASSERWGLCSCRQTC